MTTITDMFATWDSPEGHPYKGSLIDWESYDGDGDEPPDNIGCMCAQGQALHLLAGWTPKQLHDADQADADIESAKVFNISRAHAVLLRNVNDKIDGAPSVVLTDPGKVLGDQWGKLLDFWWSFDQFSRSDWQRVAAAGAAVWDAAGDGAGNAACEIQGYEVLTSRGRDVFFLPMFGWATPADIPARPADYGNGVVPRI